VRVDAETGLLYMRNRYYHVGWGRFLSIDPLGAWVDSATLGNAYAYGGNRPLVETDHYGLQVGHHVIPVSVFNDASLNLSPAAKGVFEAATTGAPSGGLPRDVHAWGHAHKRYNEAVMGEFRKLQEAGADLSKWSDKDAQRFVDRILDSADPRISRFLHQIDSWLDAAAAKGVSIKNRGIRSLPSLSWYRRCGRWLGEFGKLGKFVTIPLAVIGFSDDANAYGYSVATLNALNPIPFVDVQDILGLEPSLPPIDPPITEVLPASFIGPLAPWQARAM
jgi:RHS repeat-associated protein